jgi:hypothetical protein
MVIQTFNATKRTRRVQLPRSCPKVILSKEARAALRSVQREKSQRFKDALDDAWGQIDQVTKTIAASHHKSVWRVQNNLYLGRGALRSKQSKVNLWNAFCWKKGQETENRDFFFFCCYTPSLTLWQMVRVKLHSSHWSVITRMNIMHYQSKSKRTSGKNMLIGRKQRPLACVSQPSRRSTTSRRL